MSQSAQTAKQTHKQKLNDKLKKLAMFCNGKFLDSFVRGFGFILAIMPHWAFLGFVKGLGGLMSLLDKKSRYDDAKKNLDFIYGDKLSEEAKKSIIKRCYQNFAFVILESIRVTKIPYEKHEKRFEVIDERYLLECLDSKGSAVLISGHFGYWEAMATFLPPRYRKCQMASLGRLTGIDSVDSLIISRREFQGVKFINKAGAFKHLLRLYGGGSALAGILTDQSINKNEGIEVEFMGKKATHTPIASILSRRFEVGIVPVFIDFDKNYTKFFVRFYPPIFTPRTQDSSEDILQATQAQASITAQVIDINPSSWFWFHRRWKDFYEDLY
ncbi:lipid A biosynthesis lauroyl acyltransferase [Helicobacter sp. T3_23-1059]